MKSKCSSWRLKKNKNTGKMDGLVKCTHTKASMKRFKNKKYSLYLGNKRIYSIRYCCTKF